MPLVAAADPPWPEWAAVLGVPVWLGGAAFLIWMLITRRVLTAGEHADALAAQDRAHDEALAALAAAHNAELAEVAARASAWEARCQSVIVDRDAWRDAHREETAARRAAERAAAALMETGQISLALLSALKDALGGRPDPG